MEFLVLNTPAISDCHGDSDEYVSHGWYGFYDDNLSGVLHEVATDDGDLGCPISAGETVGGVAGGGDVHTGGGDGGVNEGEMARTRGDPCMRAVVKATPEAAGGWLTPSWWVSLPLWYYVYLFLKTVSSTYLGDYNISNYVNMDCIARVDSGIYICGLGGALNRQELERARIGAIVNLSGHKYDTDLPQLNIIMDDAPVSKSSEALYLRKFGVGMKFIDTYRTRGVRVLVHCAAGVNRSATLIAFYLMRKGRGDFAEIYKKLIDANRTRNMPVLTNPDFRKLLCRYDNMLQVRATH